MAKSLRSKWRRKCRAIKRVRYGEKELERLKKTLGIDDNSVKNDVVMEEVSKIAKITDAKTIKEKAKPKVPETDDNKMEDDSKPRKFNLKTLQDEHGTYPIWMHQRKIQRAKKARKGRPRRHH